MGLNSDGIMRCRLRQFVLSLVLTVPLGWGSAAAQQSSEIDDLDRMQDERRIALVIGNGAYGPRIGPLANPTNDARDVAAALEAVGFEVALELDAGRDRMRRAVIDFGRALRDGGVGLFYFSGHAIQVDGSNYLIPLGAEVENEDYVPVETVDVNEVLARMGGADNRLNIVILDACRNNPFKGIFRTITRGLAQTRAPTGTFIAYAAAPGEAALDGQGARNSPYTTALLEAVQAPGLRLEDVFKRVRREVLARTDRFQTPWTGSSITGDFYFRFPEPQEAESGAPARTPAPITPTAPNVVVWNAIKESTDPKDFETFIEAYPDSPLAPFARNRIAALNAAAGQRAAVTSAPRPEAISEPEPPAPGVVETTPEAIEGGQALSREDRRLVQLALNALGHDAGTADGSFDPQTRSALAVWQRSEGYPDTGYLEKAQTALLIQHGLGLDAKPESDRPVGPAGGAFPDTLYEGYAFRDCDHCPLMVALPAGSYLMGSNEGDSSERPAHLVKVPAFAIGRYEVTFDEWDACVLDGGCNNRPLDDEGFGRGRRPAIKISWDEARSYVSWLTASTGHRYRLLSEAEWEYAARAGTTTRYWWGDSSPTPKQANFGMNVGRSAEVGSYAPNAWGLHDMYGNVWEWVADCWHDNYLGAPNDGAAWTSEGCDRRVLRGGAWRREPERLRSGSRSFKSSDARGDDRGFRVARTLALLERRRSCSLCGSLDIGTEHDP